MNLPALICLRQNCRLFLTLTHSSHSKWKDILHTLNVYNIPAKQHQGVDWSAAYEISVLEILFWKYLEYVPLILSNYKSCHIYNFSILSAQDVLVITAE